MNWNTTRARTAGVAAGLACLIVLFWFPVVFLGQTLYAGDLRACHVPLQLFHHARIDGVRPLWNPYLFCGVPSAIMAPSGMFSPVTMAAHTLFSGLTAMTVQIMTNMFLGAWFMYLFARSLKLHQAAAVVAAVTFALCGDRVHHIMHLEALPATICLPLLLWLVERVLAKPTIGRLVALPLAYGWLMLIGHPQISMFISYVFAGYCLMRMRSFTRGWAWSTITRTTAIGSITAVGGLLIGAQMTIPLLELLQYSERAGGGSIEFATFHSWPPLNMILYVFPHFFGNMLSDALGCGPDLGAYWGTYYESWGHFNNYVGLLPLGLAGIAIYKVRSPQKTFFGITGLVTLLLAMGKYTPLYQLCYDFLPGFTFFRGPMHLLFLTSFCLTVLAALGAHWIQETLYASAPAVPFPLPQEKMKKRALPLTSPSSIAPAIVILGGVAVAAGLVVFGYVMAFNGFVMHAPWRGIASEIIHIWDRESEYVPTFLLAWSGLWGYVWYLRSVSSGRLPRSIPFFGALTVSLVAADLCGWFMTYHPLTAREDFVPVSAPAQHLQARDQSLYRIFTKHTPTKEDPWECFDPLGKCVNMFHRIQKTDGYLPAHIKTYNPDYLQSMGKNPRLLDLANAKYVVVDEHLRENPLAMPRAFLMNRARVIPQGAARLQALQELDPRAEVLFEDPAVLTLVPQGEGMVPHASATVTRYTPDHVHLTVSSPVAAYLILSDAFYPGWHARVDGREQPIYRANHTFRGIAVPSGTHEVIFEYRPFSVRVGGMITLAALGCAGLLAGWGRSKMVAWLIA